MTTQPSTSRPWTDAQRRAIATVGRNLLVSAAAGSGKTAVLTERCAHLVCDAADPCDVDELLVVTFTEAAATELRARVRLALQARATAAAAAGGGDTRVVRQLAGVERAAVGTLHAFCARLLRQHFHAAGLDPDFAVLDADAARLLRREVVQEVVAARYAGAPNASLHALLDGYFAGDDATLAKEVLGAFEALSSLSDPHAWLRDARARLAEAAGAGTLRDSSLGRKFAADLAHALAGLKARVHAAADIVKRAGDFPSYVEAMRDASDIVQNWARTLVDHGVDALAEETDVKFPALKPVRGNPPGKDVAKAAVDAVRKEMKEGSLRDSLRFTEALWRDGVARTVAPANELLDLVEAFEAAYRAAKVAARSLDFSDLERRALALLCEDGDPNRPSAVARGCHRRYRHVLVDEYQDINELQDAILRLVSADNGTGESRGGNLFSVGDVKQSIYRFRSAEPELFLRRHKQFRAGRGGDAIDLSTNFRSRAPLLEAVNGVFERLMTESAAGIDYADGHRLVPGATFPPGQGFAGAPIELHLLPAKPQASPDDDESDGDGDAGETRGDGSDLERAEREAAFVARRVRALTGADGSPPAPVATEHGLRDARYGDVAVLLRTRKFKVQAFADTLRKAGVPVVAQGGNGFFAAAEVVDVLSLLRVLDNAGQDVPLAAVLRGPIGVLPEPEDSFARVRLAYAGEAEPVPFHAAVYRYARERDDELAARLREILQQLDAWRELAQRRPLAQVVATVYEQSGFLAYVCGLDDGDQRRANLLELHRRATQFGQLSGQGGLGRFLRFLHALEDEADAGQATLVAPAVDAVRVLTVHESKGLEFPIVFVADLGKAINLTDARGTILYDRHEGLGLSVVDQERMVRYPSLATTVIAPRLRRAALAEELRVLYVAMTRAKERLELVGTAKDGAADRWRARWAGHAGPIGADDVLAARTALDWLGPVAAAAGEAVIAVTSHAGDAEAPAARARRDDAFAALQPFANLRPLDPAPAAHPVADAVIATLSYAYPHAAYTVAAAAQSVTGRTHDGTGGATHGGPDGAARDAPDGQGSVPARAARPTLPQPRFAAGSAGPAAAEVGTATHLVLEHLDFADGAPAIAQQVERLVSRKSMTPEQAKCVDLEAIAWLLASEVGRLLRANAATLLRELPVYFAAPAEGAPASPDPLDRVMVRGRLDLFVPTPAGDHVVDYKTDRVSPDRLADRVETYRPQLSAYADALAMVTGRRPTVWLAFLWARRVVKL